MYLLCKADLKCQASQSNYHAGWILTTQLLRVIELEFRVHNYSEFQRDLQDSYSLHEIRINQPQIIIAYMCQICSNRKGSILLVIVLGLNNKMGS